MINRIVGVQAEKLDLTNESRKPSVPLGMIERAQKLQEWLL